MQTATFTYNASADAWSVKSFPQLDSKQTLVLAFGASDLVARTDLFQLLHRAYPNSCIAGCSTGGEIADGRVVDGTLAVAVIKFDRTQLGASSLLVRTPSNSYSAGRLLA